jgi:apolipoprotein N-acyltransferase
MTLFLIILSLILLIGVLTYREYRNPKRDIREDNYIKAQMNIWSVWLSGLLLFVLGYAIDKPWLGTDSGDGVRTPLWFVCFAAGLIVFYLACLVALPPLKNDEDKSYLKKNHKKQK